MEREIIAKRTATVMQQKKLDGILRSRPKYGYKVIDNPDGTSPGRTTVINQEEQDIINEIALMIDGEPKISNSEIARRLEAQGVKLRKSKQIYPATIRKIILDNHLRPLECKCPIHTNSASK